jgi:hypothetical protein
VSFSLFFSAFKLTRVPGDPAIYGLFFDNAASLPQLVEVMQQRLATYEKDKNALNSKLQDKRKEVDSRRAKFKVTFFFSDLVVNPFVSSSGQEGEDSCGASVKETFSRGRRATEK